MPTLDDTLLQRTTRTHFLPKLKNNIYNRTRLFKVLSMKGRVQDFVGRGLEWSVVSQMNAANGLFSGYSPVVSQPINPMVGATLANANYYSAVAISMEEEKKNTGRLEKLIDILKAQMQNAESTLKNSLGTDVYGSGTSVGGLQPLIGLGAAVSASNTYAGIDRTAAAGTFWQANVNSTAYTDDQLQDSTDDGYMPRIMNDSLTSATHDGSPDIIVTTKRLYNIYQVIAQTKNLRFNNDMANLGFGGVEFGAGVTMIFDDFCTAKYMYFLNTDNWQLFVFPGADFDFVTDDKGSIWRYPINQFAKVAYIIWMGQLRLDSPWQQAVISAAGDA